MDRTKGLVSVLDPGLLPTGEIGRNSLMANARAELALRRDVNSHRRHCDEHVVSICMEQKKMFSRLKRLRQQCTKVVRDLKEPEESSPKSESSILPALVHIERERSNSLATISLKSRRQRKQSVAFSLSKPRDSFSKPEKVDPDTGDQANVKAPAADDIWDMSDETLANNRRLEFYGVQTYYMMKAGEAITRNFFSRVL